MLAVYQGIEMRVNERQQVKYARCTRTGKFVSHSKAQTIYDELTIPKFGVVLSLAVLANVVGFGAIFLNLLGVI